MPGPSTVDTTFELATGLLEACEDAVAATVGGPIDRSFVTFAHPVLDCEVDQLTVHIATIAFENTQPTVPPPAPGHRSSKRFGSLILVTYYVTVARCVTVTRDNGNVIVPPTPAELADDAQRLNQDAWSIWNTVTNRIAAGELFQGACKAAYLDGMMPLAGSGGMAGWTWQIRAAIDGYTETP